MRCPRPIEGDGRWRVWVHIADVSAFVAPRSLVDREAYRRGTSVYVPGAVEPMLPAVLSNDVCSLVPGEDRLAVTVEMTIVGEEVQRASFHRSLIRSDERLDYDRVDRVFAGHRARRGAVGVPAGRGASGVGGARRPPSAPARAGARLRGAGVHSSTAAAHVIAATPVAQTESHRLIEHLMIAANEQVAGVSRGAPRAGALPRPRAARATLGGAPDRPARVARRADAARPARPDHPTAGR